jgi:hypothetical protein
MKNCITPEHCSLNHFISILQENFSAGVSHIARSLTIPQTIMLITLSWAILEKPPIVQPLKNFPAFYENRRFITVFTKYLHWSLSWARLIQSIPTHPISLRSILTLSTHLRLRLPSGLFPSGFHTNIYMHSPIRATCPAQLTLLDLPF